VLLIDWENLFIARRNRAALSFDAQFVHVDNGGTYVTIVKQG
jgi:hypothetical protein